MSIDIAVIGLAFRFPGCTLDRELDEVLESGTRNGRSVLHTPPPDRWPFHKFDAGDLSQWHELGPCGFVDRAFEFDHALFSMSPREARVLDPQHRIALELALLSLDDGGYGGNALAGSRTGVFVGTTRTDYFDAIRSHLAADAYFAPLSNSRAVLSNRISSVFDFHGPSLTIDTLCSSSLVAIYQACRALRSRDCDCALAGGVNFLMSPQYLAVLRRMGLMSATGACRPFGENADGFVPSEGGAILCLKRLEDALRDGDNVRAVISGCGIAHHGSSGGLTVPNSKSMGDAIRCALDDAGLAPADIGLLQVMGASNALGDEAELRALSTVFDSERLAAPVSASCEKGALGHLEPASGAAGLVSAIQALERGKLYPLHGAAEPMASAAGRGIRAVKGAQQWPAGAPRRAGVSSFSMTGTHVHVIVGAAPELTRDASGGWIAFPVAADTASNLQGAARSFADAVETFDAAQVRDAAFTAAVGRRHGLVRAVVISPDASEIKSGLNAIASGAEALSSALIVRGAADDQDTGETVVSIESEPPGRDVMRLAKEFVGGAAVDWRSIQLGRRRRIRLPGTLLRAQRFLFDPPVEDAGRTNGADLPVGAKSIHPVLRNARRGLGA